MLHSTAAEEKCLGGELDVGHVQSTRAWIMAMLRVWDILGGIEEEPCFKCHRWPMVVSRMLWPTPQQMASRCHIVLGLSVADESPRRCSASLLNQGQIPAEDRLPGDVWNGRVNTALQL